MLFMIERFKFIDWLKTFIILQPILDILTFLSIAYFNLSITIGIVVRVLFMAFSVLYIFFGNKHTFKKFFIVYLIVLFIVIGLSFLINFLTKPEFYLFSEVQFLVKTLYFPIMFSAFMLCFTTNIKEDKVKEKLYSAITIAMFILSITLFLAIMTNTSNTTYEYIKSGYTGWFFAGNELSAIVAICFPLSLIYAIYRTKRIKDIKHWIPTLLLSISALLIGTKVSFFAVLMTLGISLIIALVNWLIHLKKPENKKRLTKVLLLNFILIIIFVSVTPFTPTYQNIKGDYASLNETVNEISKEEPKKEVKEQIEKKENKPVKKSSKTTNNIAQEKPKLTDSRILNIILSSRVLYFENIYADYYESDFMHKLFGLGYAGFYEGSPKLIEMDFFDIFFSYGIIGSLLIFLPLLMVLVTIIKSLFINFKKFFQTENILLLISVGLGLGVSFLAGHVLYAPAVSIYLSLALVLLYYFNKSNGKRDRE